MTEIINILQEEAKYDCTVKHDQRTYSDCIKKPTAIYSQRNNCSNCGNQLKLADSLKLVKQATVENLTEETKLVKQTTQMASNIYNPWPTAHSNKTWLSECSTTSQKTVNLWNVGEHNHIPLLCPYFESIYNTFKLSRTPTNLWDDITI